MQVFFFLPGILPELLKDVLNGGTTYAACRRCGSPGSSFGWRTAAPSAPAWLLWAAASVIASAVVAVLVSILPAELMRRRDLERRADVSTGPMMPFVRAVMTRAVRASDVRALYLFAIASLVRSRRHAVHLGTYAGLAVAAALVGIATSSIRGSLTLATPHAALLALPLVFMFFAILGLRSACAIPVDLEANWPLRLRQPTVRASLNAMRLVLLTLAVLPPVALVRAGRVPGCGARAPAAWSRCGI